MRFRPTFERLEGRAAPAVAVDGFSFRDVQQWYRDSCVPLAVFAAHVEAGGRPRVREVAPEVFRVRFFGALPVTVDLRAGYDGADARSPEPSERWVTAVERAWLKRGYWWDTKSVVEHVTGRPAEYRPFAGRGSKPWVLSRLAAGRFVVAGTWVDSDKLVAYHEYAVNRKLTNRSVVTVYNPWGIDGGNVTSGDPDDGLIQLTWAEFRVGFGDLASGRVR